MTYSINGTTIPVTDSIWQDPPAGQSLAGETIEPRFKPHTWKTNVMTAANFDALYAFEGQQVTLVTNDYADRNNTTFVTYHLAELKAVTGQHSGPLMINVTADFLVRI